MDKSIFKRRLFNLVMSFILIVVGTVLTRNSDTPEAAADTLGPMDSFLPIALKSYPLETLFGIQAELLATAGGLDQIVEADSTWVRKNGVEWGEVEPIEGNRNWSTLSALETELINAAKQNLRVILVIRSTPSWAQEIPNTPCGPIQPAKLQAFANFMNILVTRYSQAPYNVKYWEIWNEPDVHSSETSPASQWGCWGDPGDSYFGGGAYASMLEAIYPAIKSADPEAVVLVGGLLLDCNPDLPAACNPPIGSLRMKFLEGILRNNGANNGGDYFDGISFHAYDFYGHQIGRYQNQNWGSSWNTTGPVVRAKANFIRDVLGSFGVSGKILLNTEGAILCDTCSNNQVFEDTKAFYLVQIYAWALADGLDANIWYTIFGWRNSGLLRTDLSPLPAYSAFKFARSILGDAVPTEVNGGGMSSAQGGSAVTDLAFERNGSAIHVIWSLDGQDHTIVLAAGVPDEIYDAFGTPITPDPGGTFTATLNPHYLVWR